VAAVVRLYALQREWQRVDPPRRPVLIINPRSGGGRAARADLAERARERGIEPLMLRPGEDLAALVADALDRGADTLGMAGGDGSLAPVAAAAAERDVPFVCLPVGTRNHFAMDVGIARHDLLGALDAFTEGRERRIDMADVNGRPFLNNVSVGVYGEAAGRPGYRDAKVRTILDTLREVLSSTIPASEVVVRDDLAHAHTSPLVVLVSNNAYALDRPLAQDSRPRLDTGELGIVVLERPDAKRPPLTTWRARSVAIAAGAPVAAGLDGEAVTLVPPLRCTTRPAALRVRIARHHPGVSPAGLRFSGARHGIGRSTDAAAAPPISDPTTTSPG
jgi:diacylglycerol kinase family enzyme